MDFYTQVPVPVKRLREDAIPLKYAHDGDSGMDVFAVALKRVVERADGKLEPAELPEDMVTEEWVIHPGETVLACSGWAAATPLGTEFQVRPTSGNGLKTKIRIPNAPGTCDSPYRGEIGIELENTSHVPFVLKKGKKVAQLVLAPVLKAIINEVDELDDTDRGADGYGSTGSMMESTKKEHKCNGDCDGFCDGGCH